MSNDEKNEPGRAQRRSKRTDWIRFRSIRDELARRRDETRRDGAS